MMGKVQRVAILGLLFAGAFLTLLTFIPRGSSRNPLFNTLKGMLTGAPLGLCVNCATPIGRWRRFGERRRSIFMTACWKPVRRRPGSAFSSGP